MLISKQLTCCNKVFCNTFHFSRSNTLKLIMMLVTQLSLESDRDNVSGSLIDLGKVLKIEFISVGTLTHYKVRDKLACLEKSILVVGISISLHLSDSQSCIF